MILQTDMWSMRCATKGFLVIFDLAITQYRDDVLAQ